MMKKFLLPILIAVIIITVVISAIVVIPKLTDEKKDKKIVVGVVNTLAHVCYTTDDGAWTGAQCDIIRSAAKKSGYQVEFKEIYWANRNQLLKSGDIDCYISSGDTEKDVIATTPFVYSKQAVICKKELNIAFTPEIHFTNYPCGVQKDSKNHQYLKRQKATNIQFYNNTNEILTALKNDVCQIGIIDYAAYITYVSNDTKFDDLDLAIFADEYDYSLCFGKGDSETASIFNDAIKKLKNDGTIKQIITSYDLEHKYPLSIY